MLYFMVFYGILWYNYVIFYVIFYGKLYGKCEYILCVLEERWGDYISSTYKI